jgi:hypothetical protein
MLVHRTVHELGEAAGAPADEAFLVSGEDMNRWAEEAARLRGRVVAERQACRRIVEDHLRLMVLERRSDPVELVRGIIARIDARCRERG